MQMNKQNKEATEKIYGYWLGQNKRADKNTNPYSLQIVPVCLIIQIIVKNAEIVFPIVFQDGKPNRTVRHTQNFLTRHRQYKLLEILFVRVKLSDRYVTSRFIILCLLYQLPTFFDGFIKNFLFCFLVIEYRVI